MASQLCKFTKNYWIMPFKWVNFLEATLFSTKLLEISLCKGCGFCVCVGMSRISEGLNPSLGLTSN